MHKGMYTVVKGLWSMGFSAISDFGVGVFNRVWFHYFWVNSYKCSVRMCIIKFYTQQCNKIYDMTNHWKTITFVRGGDVTFFAMFIYSAFEESFEPGF